jgi:hypothetical protein
VLWVVARGLEVKDYLKLIKIASTFKKTFLLAKELISLSKQIKIRQNLPALLRAAG